LAIAKRAKQLLKDPKKITIETKEKFFIKVAKEEIVQDMIIAYQPKVVMDSIAPMDDQGEIMTPDAFFSNLSTEGVMNKDELRGEGFTTEEDGEEEEEKELPPLENEEEEAEEVAPEEDSDS
jgi:hypothetical protein